MKKFILTFAIAFVTILGGHAADLTEVWGSLSVAPNMIKAPVDTDKANKQGFTSLEIAMNPAPTEAEQAKVAEQTATISSNQKLASTEVAGFTVSIFATPADASGSLYKVLYTITGENDGVRQLILLYGTVTRENMARAMTKIDLEEIIGA